MRKRHPEKNSCSFVYIYGTGSVQYPLWKRKREKDRERERERPGKNGKDRCPLM